MKKYLAVFAILMMAATVQAATLSPMPRLYFRNSAGTQPLSNGKIYTYEVSTSTPKAVYTDSSGATAKTNPFSLDSDGGATFFLSGCYDILVATAQGVPLYTTPNICEYEEATASSALTPQWNASGITPVFVGTTSFSTSGDYTDVFEPGLRLKSTTTAGTIYSTVVSAVYAATVTTVTVVNDSGVLDSGLSEVQISVLTVANPSTPIVPVATKTTGYTILPTDCGKTLVANLSSAATFTLPAASAVPSSCTIVSKNTSSWTLTLGGTVDGILNSTLTSTNSTATIFSDATAWRFAVNPISTVTGTETTAANVIPVSGSDGRLAFGYKPAFRGALVYTTSTTTLVSGVSTSVPFVTESYDTDNIYTAATSSTKLTVPSGVTKVRVLCQTDISVSVISGTTYATIYKNNATFSGAPWQSKGAANGIMLSSPVLSVAGGDYFEAIIYQDSGSDVPLTTSMFWFSMEIVE